MEFRNILLLNVNSITSFQRQQMLIQIISNSKIDMALINETHLNSKTKFSINGFKYSGMIVLVVTVVALQ